MAYSDPVSESHVIYEKAAQQDLKKFKILPCAEASSFHILEGAACFGLAAFVGAASVEASVP